MIPCLRLILSTAALLTLSPAADSPPPGWTPVPGKAVAWNRELGSHRVILEVPEGSSGNVRALLNWRRRDPSPERKAVLVQELDSGKAVPNVAVLRCDAEAGELVFQPSPGVRRYAVYFLPVKITGGAFPEGKYTAPADTAAADWKAAAGLADGKWRALPQVAVVSWDAISAHEAWNEMEVIATAAETRALEKTPFLARLESREHPVRMFDHLPWRWVDSPPPAELAARPSEYLVFQIVVHPAAEDLKAVSLEFSALSGPDGRSLAADRLTCYNTGGMDWEGRPFSKTVDIPAGRVQPLWCGLDLPEDAAPGLYQGTVRVKTGSGESVAVPLAVRVGGEVLTSHGDDAPESLSKLRWLNSTLAQDDELPKGYEPLTIAGRSIGCLGRTVTLSAGGLPESIVSHFNGGNTAVDPALRLELLAQPMRFVVDDDAGQPLALTAEPLRMGQATPSAVDWESGFSGDGVRLVVKGHMEFDGSLSLQVAASGTRRVGDIRLETPRTPETATLSTGLGQEGGLAPEKLDWKWDVARKHQDSLWLGTVNGGLRVLLKDDRHVRAAINIHYTRRPLREPGSWANGGAGGIRYADHTLTAYSGARQLKPDEPLAFNFDLLVTPFHTLRTREQFTERYFHTSQVPVDEAAYLDKAAQAGANLINIHQGNRLNPYINYPFLTVPKLAAFTRAAHARNQRVKFYDTIRELSNWAPELFALRSLGNEILLSGKGGGHPWLEEHLAGDYWQAWFEGGVQDASVLTATLSRWNNFYVQGLQWLVKNAGCDGIYLDDISYDRGTMLRARKVLDRDCPRGGRIDLHSWNELNSMAGYANCVNVFMDSLPFVDRLWFGEGHEYSGPPPEHFLVEISGIPFGLMGEMLEGGGNPALGLTFGMTGRLGWGGDPKAVWKLWDDFGAADAAFTGWWDRGCPVKTGVENVKASVWTKSGAALISLGNFGKAPASGLALTLDWNRLGLDPARVFWSAPGLAGMQGAALLKAGKLPPLPAFGGLVILLSDTPPVIEAVPEVMSGPVLLEDRFTDATLPGWTRKFSSQISADPFKPDKGLVFTVPANVHAFIERPLPEKAGAVRASFYQDKTDGGQQWGPGLALLWPDGTALRVNRRADNRFSIGVGGAESLAGGILEAAPVEITVAWDGEQVRVIAGGPGMGGLDQEIARIPRSQLPAGPPDRLRLGKMNLRAEPKDHPEAGAPGFNRIENLSVREGRAAVK